MAQKPSLFLLADRSGVSSFIATLIEGEFGDSACCVVISRNEFDEYIDQLQDATKVFASWGCPDLSVDEIRKFFPRLQDVFYIGGDTRLFAHGLIQSEVTVHSYAHLNAQPVAEFILSMTILANKRLIAAAAAYRKPFWKLSFKKSRRIVDDSIGNYDFRIGLVGCGAVGRCLLPLLANLDCTVYVCDPGVSDKTIEDYGARRASVEEVFEQCDVVSNQLPATKETNGFITLELLEKMRTNATFINTARGSTVRDADLALILRKRKDLFAVLDVTGREPLLPTSRLFKCDNVFLTPHVAGSRGKEVGRLVRQGARDFKERI